MKQKNEQGRKKTVRRRWPCWGMVLGVVLAGTIAVLVGLHIFMYNSWGLRGVRFSYETGFYEDNIEVEMHPEGFLVTRPVRIKYNMNGDDLENTSEEYTNAVRLEVPEEGYKLYTVTATACEDNGECLDPQAAIYVLGKNLNEDITLDIININCSQENLYDYDKGIMVKGRTYDEGMMAGEKILLANYNQRGKAWMREAFITRINGDGKIVLRQNVHIGVSGGSSSEYDVKSIKFLMELPNGNWGSFRLRSGGQDHDTGNIRSSVVDRLAEESMFDGRTGTERVVVFLNGKYYGIFDMQETFSEQNLVNRFGLSKKKNVEKISESGSEAYIFKKFGLEDENWDNLDLAENRDKIEAMIDMDDYLKYYAIFIMTNNTDWPMNNFIAWRYVNGEHTDNQYEDGKIRFLIRDTDLVYYTNGNRIWFEGAVGDTFRAMMDNEHRGVGSSFRKVMKSEYYRARFINLLRDLINGPFATENVLRIIDEEAAKIEHQVELFSTEEEYEEWKGWIELMKKAASERENQIREDVKEYFGVEL